MPSAPKIEWLQVLVALLPNRASKLNEMKFGFDTYIYIHLSDVILLVIAARKTEIRRWTGADSVYLTPWLSRQIGVVLGNVKVTLTWLPWRQCLSAPDCYWTILLSITPGIRNGFTFTLQTLLLPMHTYKTDHIFCNKRPPISTEDHRIITSDNRCYKS